MAEQNRTAAHALVEQIISETTHFDFFQVMRALECLYAESKPRFGASENLADDPPVRFEQWVALEFPPAALHSWEQSPARSPKTKPLERLKIQFFGLFGPNGPLPLHLTEYVLARHRKRDFSFSRFADIFHHRLLCLFYRAWADAQPVVHYDRYLHENGLQEDRFSRYLASLSGLGMVSLRQRDLMPDQAKLLFTGHLAHQTRHADGLQAIIADFFGVTARIDEFVGEWLPIEVQDQIRLGQNSQAEILGVNTVLGSLVFGCQHKIRIVLGPLDMNTYCFFLPYQTGLQELAAIMLNYCGEELVWEMNLHLGEPVPNARLDDDLCRLGWTSWLGEKLGDAADLTLSTADCGWTTDFDNIASSTVTGEIGS